MDILIYTTPKQFHADLAVEFSEHVQRLARLQSLPLSAFNYNPVYRIMLIWECEAYINKIMKQFNSIKLKN